MVTKLYHKVFVVVVVAAVDVVGFFMAWLNEYVARSPPQGACNYFIFLSRRFHGPIHFKFEFISNSDPYRNLSNQLQSQPRTNVDMST